MPHTEKRIRHRLLSRRCNTKRRHAAYHVTTYRRLQRNGLLVAVALGRPTAIMVRCRPAVSVTFKRRWVLLLSLMCAVETRGRLFSLHVGSIGAGIEAFFSIPIPNRCWRYRPIPSTRCQHRSHPTAYSTYTLMEVDICWVTVVLNLAIKLSLKRRNSYKSCSYSYIMWPETLVKWVILDRSLFIHFSSFSSFFTESGTGSCAGNGPPFPGLGIGLGTLGMADPNRRAMVRRHMPRRVENLP